MVGSASGSGRESSLHLAIKEWYSLEGDKLECRVNNYIVDIVRGDLLIEIQTANFSAIKPKFLRLLNSHKVRLVYPIAKEKWVVHKSVDGAILRRRRSPKRGCMLDLFDELIRIPDLFLNNNFSFEVLLIESEEVWCNDGKGSWRRKGASIEDRKLIRVFERSLFENKADFLTFLSADLPDPFSNRDLAQCLGVRVKQAQKITYVLRRMGTITYIGKKVNQMLFTKTSANLL